MKIKALLATILITGVLRANCFAGESSVFLFSGDLAQAAEIECRDEQNRVISVGESVVELRNLFVATFYQILMSRNAHLVLLFEGALTRAADDFGSISRAARPFVFQAEKISGIASLRTEKAVLRLITLFGLSAFFLFTKKAVRIKPSITLQGFQILRC